MKRNGSDDFHKRKRWSEQERRRLQVKPRNSPSLSLSYSLLIPGSTTMNMYDKRNIHPSIQVSLRFTVSCQVFKNRVMRGERNGYCLLPFHLSQSEPKRSAARRSLAHSLHPAAAVQTFNVKDIKKRFIQRSSSYSV